MAAARFLISKPMWGLANRLLALTSAMRLAEQKQRLFYLAWEPSVQCMAEFHDLFSAPLPRVRIEGTPPAVRFLDSTGSLPAATRIANVIDPGLLDHDQIVMQSHSMVVTKEETFTNRNPFYNPFALEMRRYFQALGTNPVVADILKQYEGVDFSTVIGVHIRRPPPESNPSEEVFAIPSDGFYDRFMGFLLSINPNLRFYLSTNGLRTEEYFLQRYGDRILRYPKRSIDHQREAIAVQDALVDMTLLSRTRAVLRYEPSTFAYFASLIGHNGQLIIGSGAEPEALPVRFTVVETNDNQMQFVNKSQPDLVALLTSPTVPSSAIALSQ